MRGDLWTAERDAELTRLWGEGLASNEIARRMETTKNAVLGRVYRIGLSARASPITGVPSVIAVVLPVRAPLPVAAPASARRCQYPLWPDRAPVPRPARFCGAPAVTGESWCRACRAKVFTRAQMSARSQDALPPGHPLTWGALVAGTVLDGSAYTPPPPVLTRRLRPYADA